MDTSLLSVSDFVAIANQTLEYAYPKVLIEGEVSSLKISQGKYLFFDIKDSEAKLECFMMLFNMRQPLEDGMKIIIEARPKLTQAGKFSMTIMRYKLAGEGSIKKSFELLKQKLEKEGLFDVERKRSLPAMPRNVAVISSVQAAGYADFIKIANDRWGGVNFRVANVQVQGLVAPDQIISALEYLNQSSEIPDVIVIIRGGGSSDDLATFNDEKLVRHIASSRVPTLVGIGHENDTTLSELVADVRASTPSNAAQILLPDKKDIINMVNYKVFSLGNTFEQMLSKYVNEMKVSMKNVLLNIDEITSSHQKALNLKRDILSAYNPDMVLSRGYAIIRGELSVGSSIEIISEHKIATAKVEKVNERS